MSTKLFSVTVEYLGSLKKDSLIYQLDSFIDDVDHKEYVYSVSLLNGFIVDKGLLDVLYHPWEKVKGLLQSRYPMARVKEIPYPEIGSVYQSFNNMLLYQGAKGKPTPTTVEI
jgi:hypothetical protein